jgi:general secretion pathway protein D
MKRKKLTLGGLQLALVLTASLFILPLSAMGATKLNLKDADIRAVITTVSEATKMNFIVDPRVKGKVTVVSSRSLSSKELYQVFLAILDVHGFTAVPSGKVVKILPDADAKHAGTPTEGRGQEVVTQVIDIKHVAAAQLVPILRPLVPPQGHLAAHAQTNMLIVADRASNIKRLLTIIERLDEPSGSDVELIQLKHASASEVVRVLNSLQQQNKKADKTAGGSVLVADERTNTILMGGEKSERLGLKGIIAHLDTPSETVGNTHVVYLRYAQAKDLVQVLTGVGQQKAKEATSGGKKAPPAQAAKGEFMIQADENSNSLVITAPPDIFRSLQDVIRKLDVRRAQVMIEAIIAEVSAETTKELGVQWAAGGENPGTNPVGVSSFGANNIVSLGTAVLGGTSGLAATGGLPIGEGLTGVVGNIDTTGGYSYGAILNALAGDGNTNLLSTPNIITLDNEEAEIFVGDEVNVPSGSFAQTNGAISNPFTTFQAKQVGIKLKVKPQINEGDAIKLEIDQSVDDLKAGAAGQANLQVSQRTINTSVMVNDGQIIVLGGLIKENKSKTTRKIPLLGDIPLLGILFRYKKDVNIKTNLMVFLRPTILRDAAVTTNVSSSKYSFIREKQLEARKRKWFFSRDPDPLLPEMEEMLQRQGIDPASIQGAAASDKKAQLDAEASSSDAGDEDTP